MYSAGFFILEDHFAECEVGGIKKEENQSAVSMIQIPIGKIKGLYFCGFSGYLSSKETEIDEYIITDNA